MPSIIQSINQFNILDWMVVAIILLSVVLGFMRGMVREVLSLLNWVLAFWVANNYGPSLVLHAQWAEGLNPSIQALLGCALAFFGTMIVGGVIIALLGRIIQAANLGFFDRLLGIGFGALRGGLIVFVLVCAAGFTSVPTLPIWTQSQLTPWLEHAVRSASPHLPPRMARWIRF